MRTFKSVLLGSVASVAMFCACNSTQESVQLKSGLNPADFDTCIAVAYDYDSKTFVSDTTNVKSVKLYTLTNSNGMEVSITNFGGRIVSIMVPNKTSEFVDIACGFDKIENYFPWNYETDFGCSVGRYANRINNGEFIIPETTDTIRLDKNNNGYHSLHGGYTGWQYKVYDVVESTPNTLIIKAVSEDGDNKFPGKVEATVKFELTDDNAIAISYDATTDKPTIINMTNHTYFNLSGDFNNTIEESILQVNADFYTPADSTYMPTGEVRAVEGSVFDFRTPKAIGTDFVKGDAEIIAAGGGYDHNWCLNTKGNQEEICATMTDSRSGIKLEMYTNEPGVQCYTANFQDGTRPGKGGIMYQKHCAICLESQKYPDSPNKFTLPGWENSNAFVTPEKPYHSYCKYKFSIVE